MKPIIGITCNFRDSKLENAIGVTGVAGQDFFALADDYVKSVANAGGVPVILPMTSDEKTIDSYVDLCDGFIIAGGNDVTPELYGEELTNCGTLVRERDEFDVALAKKLYENDKPTFGICRGCQIMNVAFGGTLHQDVVTDGFVNHRQGFQPRNLAFHQVKVDKASLLYEIVETEQLGVNSYHHQAVKRLAEAAECAAVSEDGLCEAFYCKSKQFCLGVQWHPEMMLDDPYMQKLFKALVESAK